MLQVTRDEAVAFALFRAMLASRMRPLFVDGCAGLRPHMRAVEEIVKARRVLRRRSLPTTPSPAARTETLLPVRTFARPLTSDDDRVRPFAMPQAVDPKLHAAVSKAFTGGEWLFLMRPVIVCFRRETPGEMSFRLWEVRSATGRCAARSSREAERV